MKMYQKCFIILIYHSKNKIQRWLLEKSDGGWDWSPGRLDGWTGVDGGSRIFRRRTVRRKKKPNQT